jgi:hypothetical protein
MDSSHSADFTTVGMNQLFSGCKWTLKLTDGHGAIRLFVNIMVFTPSQWQCEWYREVECHVGFGQEPM